MYGALVTRCHELIQGSPCLQAVPDVVIVLVGTFTVQVSVYLVLYYCTYCTYLPYLLLCSLYTACTAMGKKQNLYHTYYHT